MNPLLHLGNLQVAQEKPFSSKFVLSYDHPFRFYWDFYVLVLLIYVALVSVSVVSFLGRIDTSSPWFWVERFLDVMFAIDIVLNFFTSYKGSHLENYNNKNESLRSVALRYLTTYFLFDFIPTIPWGLFADEDGDRPTALQLFRLLRLLRILKLLRLVKVLHIREGLVPLEVRLKLKLGYVRLLKLIVVVILIAHWFACIFYFFGTLHSADGTALFDSWINDDSKVPPDLYGQYIAALYFSVYTITTIGYGDVVPGTTVERTYVTIIMLLGAACFAYVISQVSDVFGELNAKTANQRRMFDSVTDLARVRKLPDPLTMDIRSYFVHYYRSKHVVDEKQVLDAMSDGLRVRVLRAVYGDAVERTGLFRGAQTSAMDSVYASVVERFAHEGDVLYEDGDDTSAVMVVCSGAVRVEGGSGQTGGAGDDMHGTTDDDRRADAEDAVDVDAKGSIGVGDVLGGTSLAVQTRHIGRAVVTEPSELLVIPRDVGHAALRTSPKLLTEMREARARELWAVALKVVERRMHFAKVARLLREGVVGESDRGASTKAVRGVPESGRIESDVGKAGGGEGTSSEGAAEEGATESDSGGAEVVRMRRQLEERTRQVQELEQRLQEVQRRLESAVGVFRRAAGVQQ